MAKRTQWIPHFTTGNATLDGQHQQMLAQCNELADCLAEGGNPQQNAFSRVLDSLMANVRAHFAVEQTLLSQNGYPLLDAHTHEGEEFEFLAAEIIRTEHFDPEELQTFLALWCTGHIVGTAPQQRPYLEPQTAATS
ncbi:MAG: hemerythrin family protein [Dechloromonas sp.]|nr:hemerythrin family protein [Dechloromonas sp.]